MTKDAIVRRFAFDVADELDLSGDIAFGQSQARSFGLRSHGFNRRVCPERAAAAIVDHPGGNPNVAIGKGRNVLLQKIDEAPLALEKRKQL